MNKSEIFDICRCCLSKDMNLNDLFKPSEKLDIAEAVQDICGVHIYKDSSLPSQICDDCLECLKTSYNFRIRTQQSNNILQGFLDTINITKKCITEQIQSVDQVTPVSTETDVEIVEQKNLNTDQRTAVSFNVITTNSKMNCPYCQKDFVHLKNLRVHMQRHFMEGKLRCSHCPKRYHTKFDLERHMFKTHSDGFPFKCELCDKHFPTRPECNRHVKTHDEKKSFSCQKCGMKFKLKHNALQHINSHEQVKPYVCDVCGKGFAFACKLKKHKLSKCKPSVHIIVLKKNQKICEIQPTKCI